MVREKVVDQTELEALSLPLLKLASPRLSAPFVK